MCAICARIAQLLRSLDLVRCQSNLFMGLQVEISDTNLDRGEFIYFWIGDFIQPSCRLFPGRRIRFHDREIFSLDFGTRENGLEIRRSVFLPVEIHARRFPVSTSPYRPRKLGATGDTYSWCLAQGMHDYEFDPLHTIV